MKTIGLIGGMSWESSAAYYRAINQHSKALLGGHRNVPSLMVTVSFQAIKDLQEANRWADLGVHMAQAARQLQDGGADVVLLCTNTMHEVAAAIEDVLDVPFLHIVDPTARALLAAGVTRVGLLGTRFTMERDFYRGRMQGMHGLEVLTPALADRVAVHRIIYDELCHGVVLAPSRAVVVGVVDRLRRQGAGAVILGCTELMLLLGPGDVALPVFDTTDLHAQAAVALALAADG
jgi:aspartate racemase